MSLMDKIENVQKKPETIRRRIVAVSVFVIMFLVIVIWVSTIRLSFGADDTEKETASIYSPFSMIKDIIKDGFKVSGGGIKEAFGQIKDNYEK